MVNDLKEFNELNKLYNWIEYHNNADIQMKFHEPDTDTTKKKFNYGGPVLVNEQNEQNIS